MKKRIRMAMALSATIIMTTSATAFAAYSWEETPKAPAISSESQIIPKTYSWIEAPRTMATFIMPIN